MRVSNDVLFTNEAVSDETTVSEAVEIAHIYGFSVWASWSGTTISGSIKIEGSIDGTNFLEVASSNQTISAASSYLWNISDAMYRYFRISVTANDVNTITVNAKYYAKGV